MSTEAFDFELTCADGDTFTFDSAYRAKHNALFVWYRGYW